MQMSCCLQGMMIWIQVGLEDEVLLTSLLPAEEPLGATLQVFPFLSKTLRFPCTLERFWECA